MSLVAIEQAYKDNKESINEAFSKLTAAFGGIDNFLFKGAKVLINADPADSPLLCEVMKDKLNEKDINDIIFLSDIEKDKLTKVMVPNSLIVEEIEVYKAVAEADVIFNIVSMAGLHKDAFALAIYKLTSLISDAAKEKFAKTYSARALVDLYQTITPQLNIVDNLIVEANTYDEPSFLMASTDAVALDSLAALYIGADTQSTEYLLLAHQYGLGIGNLDEINITGNYEGIFTLE